MVCRFWQCPNGKECQYRHALPPGYVLKSQMKVSLPSPPRQLSVRMPSCKLTVRSLNAAAFAACRALFQFLFSALHRGFSHR